MGKKISIVFEGKDLRNEIKGKKLLNKLKNLEMVGYSKLLVDGKPRRMDEDLLEYLEDTREAVSYNILEDTKLYKYINSLQDYDIEEFICDIWDWISVNNRISILSKGILDGVFENENEYIVKTVNYRGLWIETTQLDQAVKDSDYTSWTLSLQYAKDYRNRTTARGKCYVIVRCVEDALQLYRLANDTIYWIKHNKPVSARLREYPIRNRKLVEHFIELNKLEVISKLHVKDIFVVDKWEV